MPGIAYPERVVNVNVQIADVTRNPSTTYQNTSNRPKLLVIPMQMQIDPAGSAIVDFFVSSTTPPLSQQQTAGLTLSIGDLAKSLHLSIIIVIPPKWYYQYIESIVGGGTTIVYLQMKEVTL